MTRPVMHDGTVLRVGLWARLPKADAARVRYGWIGDISSERSRVDQGHSLAAGLVVSASCGNGWSSTTVLVRAWRMTYGRAPIHEND